MAPLQGFPQFGNLVAELQWKVWQSAVEQIAPQTLEICGKIRGLFLPPKFPFGHASLTSPLSQHLLPLLLACHASNSAVHASYKPAFLRQTPASQAALLEKLLASNRDMREPSPDTYTRFPIAPDYKDKVLADWRKDILYFGPECGVAWCSRFIPLLYSTSPAEVYPDLPEMEFPNKPRRLAFSRTILMAEMLNNWLADCLEAYCLRKSTVVEEIILVIRGDIDEDIGEDDSCYPPQPGKVVLSEIEGHPPEQDRTLLADWIWEMFESERTWRLRFQTGEPVTYGEYRKNHVTEVWNLGLCGPCVEADSDEEFPPILVSKELVPKVTWATALRTLY